MSKTTEQGELFADVPSPKAAGSTTINERCSIRDEEGQRAVIVAGVAIAHFTPDDRMAEAYAMVFLVEEGWADQNDVAMAFGCSVRTVRRHQARFSERGLAGLGAAGGFPRGQTRLPASRSRQIKALKAQGKSNRAIARRLGVTEKAVRKTLRRQGWKAPEAPDPGLPFEGAGADPNLSAFRAPPPTGELAAPVKPALSPRGAPKAAPGSGPQSADPNLSAFSNSEMLPVSYDTDPADRSVDRMFACLGLLDDAAPLFRSGRRVPHAGVLLAVPALLKTGVLECAQETYDSLGPAFYGLRTSIVALLLMALLRIKRPEALKEHAPDDLGRLLGLDRAPEVKTLRRKLSRLAACHRATSFGRALAKRRVEQRGAALGFLYLDGHVRVYHGKREIPYAHVARMRISMPGTTDYWVNDGQGEPLFVVTAEANAGLWAMLPPILQEVRGLLGERRITIVFDRGGWSPRLFQKIDALGFDILTYRKGHFRHAARRLFHQRTATIDGCKVSYLLADQEIRLLGGKLRLRQVIRRSDNGHQTPIVTSRRDLRSVEVAYRMFERWRQENFFKYLREEYALDALADHQAEPADPTREVPNPVWKALTKELRQERSLITGLSARLGLEAMVNVEDIRRTLRGFKSANAPQAREIVKALERHARLEVRRASVPRRVPVAQTSQEPVIKLAVERQHLTNVLKMVAYQAESDLVALVSPHYKRAAQEGRTLIQTALAAAADLEVGATELHVKLASLSSPHRTRAVAALCHELNAANVCFPGSRLRLRYSIEGTPASPARGGSADPEGRKADRGTWGYVRRSGVRPSA